MEAVVGGHRRRQRLCPLIGVMTKIDLYGREVTGEISFKWLFF